MLTWKTKALIASAPLVAIVGAVLTNPSQDRHMDKWVRVAQQWEAEHLVSCPNCTALTSSEQLQRVLGDIYIQGNLRRRNYGLFSAISPNGLREAKTVGVYGMVFGPRFEGSYRCPSDMTLSLPETTEFASSPEVLEFSLEADETILHEGMPISRQQLTDLIHNVDDTRTTGVKLRVHRDCSSRLVNQITQECSERGFRITIAVQVEGKASVADDLPTESGIAP